MTIKLPAYLLETIEQGNCVLFIGAGVSREAGVPTASELAKKLADEARYPPSFPKDLFDVSEYYQAKFGRGHLFAQVKDLLSKPSQPSETYWLIASLVWKFNSIITTNYDSLLENALTELKQPYYDITEAKDLGKFAFSSRYPVILKLHGDLKANNILLTKSDYYRFLDTSFESPIGAVLRAKLATGGFLFVGYSLRDYNFVAMYESVRKYLGSHMQKGFAVMPSPNAVDISLWSKRGVELIDATAKDFFEELSRTLALPYLFDIFVAYSHHDKEWASRFNDALTSKGLKTFLAEKEIRPGDLFAQKLTQGIIHSLAYVILLTPESIRSEWMTRELQIAQSIRSGRIFPILVKDCVIPAELRDIQYIDARSDFELAVKQLKDAIQRKYEESSLTVPLTIASEKEINLKAIRIGLRKTKAALAREASISVKTISAIESGASKGSEITRSAIIDVLNKYRVQRQEKLLTHDELFPKSYKIGKQ